MKCPFEMKKATVKYLEKKLARLCEVQLQNQLLLISGSNRYAYIILFFLQFRWLHNIFAIFSQLVSSIQE